MLEAANGDLVCRPTSIPTHAMVAQRRQQLVTPYAP